MLPAPDPRPAPLAVPRGGVLWGQGVPVPRPEVVPPPDLSPPPQHFYQNRAQPPASASRVQSNTTARPGPPAHVYPAASQVMMIPSQISYTPSQGAYYIPGQVRDGVLGWGARGCCLGLEVFVLGSGGGPGALQAPSDPIGVFPSRHGGCRRCCPTTRLGCHGQPPHLWFGGFGVCLRPAGP